MNKIGNAVSYIFGLIGVSILLLFTVHTDRSLWVPTFLLCFLTIMIDLIPMRLHDKTTFSFNSALFIVAILQYDASVAMVAGTVELLIIKMITRTKTKYLFYNLGNTMLTAYLTYLVWHSHIFLNPSFQVEILFVTLISYMLLNSCFAALALRLFVVGQPFWGNWMRLIKEYYQEYLVTEIIGLMFASLLHNYGLGVMFIVSVFLILFYGVLNKFYKSVLHERDVVEKLKNSSIKTFLMLASTVDARDPYTHGHSTRVALYSRYLAKAILLTDDEIDDVYYAGLLHDIGKIGIQDSILRKPGGLTREELLEMQQHPVKGEEMLKQWDEFNRILPAVRWHHERYDGKGYPDGKIGEETPLIARLLSVCDAFDAMTSDRPYRKGMPIEKALNIIENEKGTQFDPFLASKFIEMIENMDADELRSILITEREERLVGIK